LLTTWIERTRNCSNAFKRNGGIDSEIGGQRTEKKGGTEPRDKPRSWR
jgi:hypothetical protein